MSMAKRMVDDEEHTRTYLIEVIRHTHTVADLVRLINRTEANIAWEHVWETVPTGQKALHFWRTELPRIGVNVHSSSQALGPHTSGQLPQQPSNYPITPGGPYRHIAPRTENHAAISTPRNQAPSQATVQQQGNSGGKKRGRPPKEHKGPAQSSDPSQEGARPKKRSKQQHAGIKSPVISSNAPSALTSATSTTSPATLSSAGLDSSRPYMFPRAYSVGLPSSTGGPQLLPRINTSPPAPPSQELERSFPFPQPTTSYTRDEPRPFILPGIHDATASGAAPFFTAPQHISASRPHPSNYSQPPTPSGTSTSALPALYPHPPARYDSSQPRPDSRQRSQDRMER